MNPYQPTDTTALAPEKSVSKRTANVAVSLLLAPFIVAFPIRYWVFNIAGTWIVSTNVEHEPRRGYLGLMYLALLASISIIFWFASALLFWKTRFHPLLSGFAAIVLGLLMIPAIGFIAICIDSYIRYH